MKQKKAPEARSDARSNTMAAPTRRYETTPVGRLPNNSKIFYKNFTFHPGLSDALERCTGLYAADKQLHARGLLGIALAYIQSWCYGIDDKIATQWNWLCFVRGLIQGISECTYTTQDGEVLKTQDDWEAYVRRYQSTLDVTIEECVPACFPITDPIQQAARLALQHCSAPQIAKALYTKEVLQALLIAMHAEGYGVQSVLWKFFGRNGTWRKTDNPQSVYRATKELRSRRHLTAVNFYARNKVVWHFLSHILNNYINPRAVQQAVRRYFYKTRAAHSHKPVLGLFLLLHDAALRGTAHTRAQSYSGAYNADLIIDAFVSGLFD